jgi:hypothetical protein
VPSSFHPSSFILHPSGERLLSFLSLAWLSAVREDVGLLANAFLPEFLLVTVLLLVLLVIKRFFSRGIHHSS